jgi:hypothetical protein
MAIHNLSTQENQGEPIRIKDSSNQSLFTLSEGDYVEEGFLNTLRKAPELSFLTFIIIMIMVKWYMVLLESRRVIS